MAKRPRATIEFQEIFLFVVRKRGLTVLAPRKGHKCFLSGPNLPKVQLTDHLVTLLKGSKPVVGAVKMHNERRMVHLDTVLGKNEYRLAPKAEIRRGTSARFELGGPGATLQHRPISPITGNPKYANVLWEFGQYTRHRLTNRARFTFSLVGKQFSLQITNRKTGRVVQSVPVLPGLYVARMVDSPEKIPVIPRKKLTEFGLFYDVLRNRRGKPIKGPIPVEPAKHPMPRPIRKPQRCLDPLCPNGAAYVP